MSKLLAVALCLLSTPALAKVEVGIRTEKVSYLAGEPVFILVDIRNVGDQPMAYGAGTTNRLTFVVANGRQKPVKSLSPCGGPVTGNAAGGVMHPPVLKPGAQTTERYLSCMATAHARLVRTACLGPCRRALGTVPGAPQRAPGADAAAQGRGADPGCRSRPIRSSTGRSSWRSGTPTTGRRFRC